MLVWIFQTGEPLHIDKGGTRPMRAINLSNKLIEAGHEVVLWSSAFSHQDKKHRTKEYTVHRVNSNLEIRLIPSCGYQKHIGLMRLLDHFHLAWNLNKILKEECSTPDIGFIGYPPIETAVVASRWFKERSIPTILDIKDLWPSMFVDIFPKLLRPIARIIFHPYFYLAKKTIKDAQGVSSMAPAFLEWVLKFSNKTKTKNDKVFRLTTSNSEVGKQELLLANKWWQSQGLDRSKTTIFFVGSFMSVFDFNPVLAAAKELDSCQFFLCGSGDYLKQVKNKAQGMSNVFFPGWIDRSKIEALANVSIASLAPYKNIDNFIVNTPNKIVDSLSLGLPILSPLQGEVKTLIDKYNVGMTYDNNLKECIDRLVNNKQLQRDMSLNARKLYQKDFDFNIIYDDFVNHMEGIVNG